MSRRSDRPTDDYNEIAPALWLDPDDRWHDEPSETASLGIRREQTPKPRTGSWTEDDPEPRELALTPRQAGLLAVYEYEAAWRRIRRANGGAA